MESTVMGLVRGTLILAFVLGLPAIALFGVPEEVRVLLESDFLPWNGASTATHDDHQHATDLSITASIHSNSHSHDHDLHKPSFFARTESTHADESETVEDAGSRIALATVEARVLHRPVFRPLGGEEKSEVVRHVPTVDVTSQSQRGPRSDASVVVQIEARLRQLGALNYQLQQQSGGGSFRFVCSCANDRSEQRTFEAASEDRLQAMQNVLEQVTAWRDQDVFGYFPRGR